MHATHYCNVQSRLHTQTHTIYKVESFCLCWSDKFQHFKCSLQFMGRLLYWLRHCFSFLNEAFSWFPWNFLIFSKISIFNIFSFRRIQITTEIQKIYLIFFSFTTPNFSPLQIQFIQKMAYFLRFTDSIQFFPLWWFWMEVQIHGHCSIFHKRTIDFDVDSFIAEWCNCFFDHSQTVINLAKHTSVCAHFIPNYISFQFDSIR